MKKPIRTILFDLDGTLIDTEVAASKATVQCCKKWNLTLTPEDAGFVTGRTWESAIQHLFSRYSFPVSQEEALTEIIESYREILKTDLTIVPGGADAVRSLAPHFSIGLVSGSRRAEILWALEKLQIREHFKVILGAEDYPRSKPAPDGYLKAMSMLGCDGPSCLIFEDSTAGIASARAAGAWVVAITSTNHFHQDHTQAHQKIADLTPVNPNWIQQLPLS